VLVVDGVRIELEAVVVLVANCGEAIPGTLRPRLPLDAADGLLHVFVLPRGGIVGGVRGMLELMIAETRGSSASGHSMRLAGHEVRVEMTPAAATQVDGDAYPPAWLDARVEPGALRIIGGAAG
jgi:diacylglycerol kinase family enzyme